MATRRQSILETLVARVELILTSNGFDTDAGQKVHFGEIPEIGPDDPAQLIAVVVGVEQPLWMQHGLKAQIMLPVSIAAIVNADLSRPYLAVEQVIGDIKRAVELEDRYLGGLLQWPFERGTVQTLQRESGSTSVGASVSYVFRFEEGWGVP